MIKIEYVPHLFYFSRMPPTCSVCFDPFNKSTRAETKCPHCSISICRTCLQTYLLNDINDVPICINRDCLRGWEREFLDGELTSAFRLKIYKEHREKVLSDREKARLPSTQEDAAAYKQAKQIYSQSLIDEEATTIEYNKIANKLSNIGTLKYRSRAVLESFGLRRMPVPGERTNRTEQPVVSRAAFIKPCPATDCKGFLSTAWKCGLCEQWTCPECHDLKGPAKDVEHTCDPEKIATARLLAREAKSCPKCGVQICKIEGCDQMWCTACNTGFNWRTGKIAEGAVHNPHYFEWLRSRGINPAPGTPPPLNCNQQQDRDITLALYGTPSGYGRHISPGPDAPKDPNTQYLAEVWRIMREEEDAAGNNINFNEHYRQLRVKYMIGDISEEEWKTQLQRKEKDVNFQQAKSHIRDVFVNASRDIIRQVLTPEANRADIVKSVEELIVYCNNCYETASKRFNRKIPKIKIVLRNTSARPTTQPAITPIQPVATPASVPPSGPLFVD